MSISDDVTFSKGLYDEKLEMEYIIWWKIITK